MSKHRKVILLIILNALISFVLLIVTDYIFFKYIYNGYINSLNEKHKLEETDGHIRYKTFDFNIDDFHTTNVYNVFLEKKYYHDVIIPDKYNGKKAPIVLFGDSYTWLYPDTGLQKLLAEYTKRPVFNFAFWGWGAQHMYYLTQKDLLYKIINSENFEKNPEYIVYTYIRDHKNRLYSVMDYFLDIKPYLTYEKTNDKLKIKEYSFFHKLLFRLFLYRYFLNEHKNYDNTFSYNILYDLINESKKEILKHYPDIKFVILYYNQEKDIIKEENEMFEKLRNMGFICISTKNLTKEDLSSSKYTDSDGYHPNPSAWRQIVPNFSKIFK